MRPDWRCPECGATVPPHAVGRRPGHVTLCPSCGVISAWPSPSSPRPRGHGYPFSLAGVSGGLQCLAGWWFGVPFWRGLVVALACGALTGLVAWALAPRGPGDDDDLPL
jgi:hypothetical protein